MLCFLITCVAKDFYLIYFKYVNNKTPVRIIVTSFDCKRTLIFKLVRLCILIIEEIFCSKFFILKYPNIQQIIVCVGWFCGEIRQSGTIDPLTLHHTYSRARQNPPRLVS